MCFEPLLIKKTLMRKPKAFQSWLLREPTKQGRKDTKAKTSGDRWRRGNLFSCDVQEALPSSLSQQPKGLCWLHSALYCGSCCASPGAKRQWTYAVFPWQHSKNQFEQITYLITHIYEVLQVLKRQNLSNRCMEQNHCLSNLFYF